MWLVAIIIDSYKTFLSLKKILLDRTDLYISGQVLRNKREGEIILFGTAGATLPAFLNIRWWREYEVCIREVRDRKKQNPKVAD